MQLIRFIRAIRGRISFANKKAPSCQRTRRFLGEKELFIVDDKKDRQSTGLATTVDGAGSAPGLPWMASNTS